MRPSISLTGPQSSVSPSRDAVLNTITGLGEEVIFDTADVHSRKLFVHNVPTLVTVTDGAGEMKNPAAR